jgi:hypothetical protein
MSHANSYTQARLDMLKLAFTWDTDHMSRSVPSSRGISMCPWYTVGGKKEWQESYRNSPEVVTSEAAFSLWRSRTHWMRFRLQRRRKPLLHKYACIIENIATMWRWCGARMLLNMARHTGVGGPNAIYFAPLPLRFYWVYADALRSQKKFYIFQETRGILKFPKCKRCSKRHVVS